MPNVSRTGIHDPAGSAWLDDLLRTAQARVILRLLGGCGLRVAELAAARLQDVVPARSVVADRAVLAGRRVGGWQLDVIDGKGGRDRTVRMIPSARRAIEVLHGQLATSSLMLVPALSGHRSARALARGVVVRTVQATIMRLAEHANRAARVAHAGAGMDDGLADVVALGCAHPHALRRGYVLRYLSRDGATLAGLSRALGHTAIATTARYLAAHGAALEPVPSDPWAH